MKTKAQSALEYMMTYGWAILIIVIVAVVLYSMGIFNPSAAAGNTSSGFGGFSVTSFYCSATHGLNVTLGNNQGYSITPKTVTLLTATPSTLGVDLNTTGSVAPGGIIKFEKLGSSVCGSAGNKYSIEFTFEYTLSSNSQTYTTTGTVQGTVAS